MMLAARSVALVAVAFAASGAAVAADVEEVTVRATAHFDFDSTDVLPPDQQKMLAEVSKMQGVTWQKVKASGHTDAIGPTDYNDELAQRRAQAVKTFLVGKGLDPAMIDTAGAGESAPVADNESAAGRAKNRRTEVEFVGVRAASR